MRYLLVERDKGVEKDTFGVKLEEGEVATPPGELVQDEHELYRIAMAINRGQAELRRRERTGSDGLDIETYRVLDNAFRPGWAYDTDPAEPEACRQIVAVDVLASEPLSASWAALQIGTMLAGYQRMQRQMLEDAGPDAFAGNHDGTDRALVEAALDVDLVFATAPYRRPVMLQLEHRLHGGTIGHQPMLVPPGMTKERALELVAEIAAAYGASGADASRWSAFIEQLEEQGFAAPEQIPFTPGASTAE